MNQNDTTVENWKPPEPETEDMNQEMFYLGCAIILAGSGAVLLALKMLKDR